MESVDPMKGGDLTQRIPPDSAVSLLSAPPNKVTMIFAGVLVGLSFFICMFHLFSAFFGQPDPRLFRSMHLTVMLMLAFFYYPLGRKSWRSPLNWFFLIDFVLVVLTLFVHVYLSWDISKFLMKDPDWLDVIVGSICLLLVLEAARRSIGWIIVIIAGFFLFHTHYSDLLFGMLYGPPMSWRTMIDFLFMQAVGVYGVALAAMASYIFLFIIFGDFLMYSGGGNFFIDLATSWAGHRTGGPAKVAVISSAIFGTMSGSAVANVVTTGSFTIPLMKKVGYEPKFAAATEAVASSGGQIMPPVMGASAFIMAEYLGIPYIQVCIAAAIPALLYFFSVFVMVDLEARKKGFRVLKKEELPNMKAVLKTGGHLIIPVVIIIALLVQGYTAMMAGFGAIISTLILTLVKKATRMSPSQILEVFVVASKAAAPVAVACACAGIITGAMEISGIAIRFSSLILDSSGGILLVALLFTALAVIMLGLPLPTVAIYVLLAALVAPTLVKMGAVPIAAHLFIFYFGVMAFVTPPDCTAAFAAAGIAGSNPMATGWTATRLGIVGFIVPFMFVYGPELVFRGTLLEIGWAVVTAMTGVIAIGVGVQGWLLGKATILERLVSFAGGLLLIKPGLISDVIGFVCIGIVLLLQSTRYPKSKGGNQI